ncbi:ABC transporter ATP-binding protein [soil metagenome]
MSECMVIRTLLFNCSEDSNFFMALLEIEDLAVAFGPPDRPSTVVDGVGFSIDAHETVALVGESGSGKSVTALAIMRLLQEPGRVTRGAIRFGGRDLARLSERAMAAIRGDRIAMIFQEPMSSLNPLLSIGGHVAEPLRLHRGLSRRDARARAIALLDRVGIPSAAERYDDYPHRMSGGMRQRVMIAAALACEPALLIADEPTTALDVTIQAQIMDLLSDLQAEFGMGILFITHDLGVVAEQAHRTVVMYAGRLVERAETATLFAAAAHPYSAALLSCIPDEESAGRLAVIEGSVPSPAALPPGCRFGPRCPRVVEACRAAEPALVSLGPNHAAACIRPLEQVA